jgi:hypothetical protein
MSLRFDEAHKAPALQISYQKKVEAMFQCLDGVAKQSAIGFEGACSQLHYLHLWHLLSCMETEHKVFWHKPAIASEQLRKRQCGLLIQLIASSTCIS